MFDPRAAAGEFSLLGFDTLPLLPGSKKPACRAWQTLGSELLWQSAPANSNLGLRAGGANRAAFLDCDTKNQPETFERAQGWLATLGYLPGDYPVIQTLSGGKHIYLAFTGALPGAYRNLSPDFGAGEFRFGIGAYVVAPPSEVGGVTYSLLDGDYRQLPRVSLTDVLPLLQNQSLTPEGAKAGKEKPHISRLAGALLFGKIPEKYRSRSEAEEALVASLINTGHDFDSILALFMSNPCAGKFSELRKKSESRAIAWLKRSYDEAIGWTSSHESPARQAVLAAIQWAENTPWPGRTGAIDRLVFLAHAQLAYRAYSLTYAASCRDLAERARVSSVTATNSTRRLIGSGLLSMDTPSTRGTYATLYNLQPPKDITASISAIPEVDIPLHLLSTPCEEVLSFVHFSDLFRWGGLSKSAGEIWQALSRNDSLSVKELAAQSGRSEKTIKRALNRMSSLADTTTGELLSMVERQPGGKWRAVEGVNLRLISEVLGTAGASERQRAKHKAERKARRQALELGRMSKNGSEK
jgi:predicted transcriptional regulator